MDAVKIAGTDIDSAEGWVAFTDKFRYLGSIFASDLDDDHDINRRIASAAAAFGALRKPVLTDTAYPLKIRMEVYEATTLNLLLYGCETWALRADQLQRLNVFHHRCLRSILRVTRFHRVSNRILYKSTRSQSITNHVDNRTLKWMGKVARMGDERTPARMMFGWVTGNRPPGAPKRTMFRRYQDLLGERVGMLRTVRDTLRFRKTIYKTKSSWGPHGVNITHTPCKMTKLAYFNDWHVVAKQHPGIWRRLINVANHRAIKTSKGWTRW